jgi:hypothetical protein
MECTFGKTNRAHGREAVAVGENRGPQMSLTPYTGVRPGIAISVG